MDQKRGSEGARSRRNRNTRRRRAPACIISTAQHARPKVIGQSEPRRAQLTSVSTLDTTYSPPEGAGGAAGGAAGAAAGTAAAAAGAAPARARRAPAAAAAAAAGGSPRPGGPSAFGAGAGLAPGKLPSAAKRRGPLTTKDVTSIADGLRRIYVQKVRGG
jgi:hypothetical protein